MIKIQKTPSVELPWSKREIIDAMVAEYRPYQMKDPESGPTETQYRALQRLVLGENVPNDSSQNELEYLRKEVERLRFANRVAERKLTEVERAAFRRLGRVWEGLHDGCDLNIAYEIPARGEVQ